MKGLYTLGLNIISFYYTPNPLKLKVCV